MVVGRGRERSSEIYVFALSSYHSFSGQGSEMIFYRYKVLFVYILNL